jgi:ParB family transcriptional regulator, chromosome partitioning protein
MTKLPEGKTRLDLVREGIVEGGLKKRGRLIVNIDRLNEDPRNERRTFRNMEGLIASIQTMGLIEPITVTSEEGSEKYKIITGHRRFRAAKAAGLQQVEILIREPEDELTRRVKSIISNVQREDVSPVEMAEALQALLDEDSRVKTQRDLAALIGKDEIWVSGMLRILSLPTNLQQKLGAPQVSVGYDAMIRIARLEDHEQQRQMVDVVVSGLPGREVRRRINEIKSEPTSSDGAPAKPKRVFHTSRKAMVIVQATTSRLTTEDTIAALKEALLQTSKPE